MFFPFSVCRGLVVEYGGTLVSLPAGDDLGDVVAVLNLDGDLNDPGVVHAVLGSDLAASVGHGLGDRVGNSVSHRQRSSDVVGHSDGGNGVVGNSKGSNGVGKTGVGNTGMSEDTGVGEVLGISLGISLPLAVVALATLHRWGHLASIMVFGTAVVGTQSGTQFATSL